MNIPPYFKQEKQATCSLAVLRMALAHFGINLTEHDLEEKIKTDYGNNFKNIWNPTIAKLACEYGLKVVLSADWSLLKKENIIKAIDEYKTSPETFNVMKYENPNDTDQLPEPLPLSYKELFLAIEFGCQTEFGDLNEEILRKFINEGNLIQTSIKLQNMYPNDRKGFHSILIYGVEGDTIYFHDPYRGKELSVTVDHLLKATTDVGAFMVYKSRNK